MSSIPLAVILAAGLGSRLQSVLADKPKGLLQLGEKTIIEESIDKLQSFGIPEIILVTGHCARDYLPLKEKYSGLSFVHNEQYANSGSMYSLYTAREQIGKREFLLLESDLVYEKRALTFLLHSSRSNCILLSGHTGSGDEVYVGGTNGRIAAISKQKDLVANCVGELVGVSKISRALFEQMAVVGQNVFRTTLKMEYESCIVAASETEPAYFEVIPDLAWTEIDDPAHFERAKQKVYPLVQERDGVSPAGPAFRRSGS